MAMIAAKISSTSITPWEIHTCSRYLRRDHRHDDLLRRIPRRDLRAGIQSIHRGQMEAAIALGLTRGQALRRIILPQTVRVVLPPLGNEFIALLKDSSLVSILAVSDLLRRGREYASKTFDYFEAFTVVALAYLVMTLFFSRMVALMEERMNRGGR